jgi:hypothetical protein
MPKKTYAEKLKHPKWQKKRLEILNRDRFKCTACHSDDIELHIHHKTYLRGREPWQYENDNLVTLCKFCHRITELLKEELIEVLIYDIGEKYQVYYALVYISRVDSYTTYTFFINDTIFELRAAIGCYNLQVLCELMENHQLKIHG